MGRERFVGTSARVAFVMAALGGLSAACGSTVITDLGFGGAGGSAASTGSVGTGSSNGSTGSGSPGSSGSGVSTGSAGGAMMSGASSSSSTGGGPDCTNNQCVGGTPQGNCDSALMIDSADAMDGARAIGLCQVAANGSWGVKSATWVRSDGSPLGMGDVGDLQLGKGILPGFGPNVQVREGTKLLALSSGSARQPSDGMSYHSVGGYQKDSNPHQAPPGYPKASATCPGITPGAPHDSAGLQVVIHTPNDAKSIAFNLDFYSYEFPNFVCSQYDDTFVAIMNPKPAALSDGNLSFDSTGDALSPHSNLLRVCTPGMAGGQSFACVLGPSQLTGTGFDEQVNGSAATGWLLTTAPIEQPGADITLLFTIWDSTDQVEDSTVLIDNFKFVLTDATTVTVAN